MEESSNHINSLELIVVRLGLLAFQDLLSGQHVLVYMDNMTVKVYVNRQGDTRYRCIHKKAKSLMH